MWPRQSAPSCHGPPRRGVAMSAQLQPHLPLRPMQHADLDAVMSIERSAYSFPWTRGNFIDSLAAGYLAEVLVVQGAGLVGYYVAMQGVEEMHLLNLTVAPAHQRRGHSRTLLDALQRHGLERHLHTLWLEVRLSNQHARRVYAQRGFAEVGLRRGYYPASHAQREDAIVMSLALQAGQAHGLD
jgi:ribosomal-protein-alanine N-acetyltransferase